MPLTTRSNGSSGSNIITASWFNDFKNLLTGAMSDQEVTITNNVVAASIGASPASTATGAIAAGTTLGIGNYLYYYTYLSPDGESAPSPTSATVTTTSGNQKINVTVTVGPTGTTGRNIYRTKVGGSIFYKVSTGPTISDNTTTVYADVTPDSSLTVTFQGYNTFGGSLITKDASGVTRSQLTNDGALNLYTAPVTINGTTSGTATLYQTMRGTVKSITIIFNNFCNNTGGNQALNFPVPFVNPGSAARIMNFGSPPFNLLFQGVAQGLIVFTALASGGGTTSNVTVFPEQGIGYVENVGIDAIVFFNNAVHFGGVIMIEGV